jgi:hypothetical protein
MKQENIRGRPAGLYTARCISGIRASEVASNSMPFEHRMCDLSERLANCPDDATALSLALELQAVLHERIEQLREKTAALPLLTNQLGRRS